MCTYINYDFHRAIYGKCVSSLSVPVKQKNYLNPFTATWHSTHKPLIHLCVWQVTLSSVLAWFGTRCPLSLLLLLVLLSVRQATLSTTLAWLKNLSYIFVSNRQLSALFWPDSVQPILSVCFCFLYFWVSNRWLGTNLVWLSTNHPLSLSFLIQVLKSYCNSFVVVNCCVLLWMGSECMKTLSSECVQEQMYQ